VAPSVIVFTIAATFAGFEKKNIKEREEMTLQNWFIVLPNLYRHHLRQGSGFLVHPVTYRSQQRNLLSSQLPSLLMLLRLLSQITVMFATVTYQIFRYLGTKQVSGHLQSTMKQVGWALNR